MDIPPVPLASHPAPQSKLILSLAAAVIILAGIGTGFFMSRKKASSTLGSTASSKSIVKTETEAGTTDTSTFSDTTSGVLEAGGSNGEGTHHLVRPGGNSQTVYLVSSLVDLDQYLGKKIEVFGQTIRAQKVGWLMDVGRVKILE